MTDWSPDERALGRLLDVMQRLRDPQHGCPWDRDQNFPTIAPYTVEEAYEVADAIRHDDGSPALVDELGDLLFQVVFYAQMARESGRFGFAEIAAGIANKMVRRHPHVFGDAERTGRDLGAAWDAAKAGERAARRESGTLSGIPAGLPALTRAVKLTRRAARVGFDWPDAGAVLEKLAEETAELQAELPGADKVRLQDELGDMLFVLANLARKLELDPETCLRGANAKFERRFGALERALAEQGRSPADASLEEMEEGWQAAKRAERR